MVEWLYGFVNVKSVYVYTDDIEMTYFKITHYVIWKTYPIGYKSSERDSLSGKSSLKPMGALNVFRIKRSLD